MKCVKILHNPGAGEKEYTGVELVRMLEQEGYTCRYASTKSAGWDEIDDDIELIVLAGGDGTIRKVVARLLQKGKIEKPFAILPMGTANNICRTLNIYGRPEDIIRGWGKGELKQYDVGRIRGLEKDEFFLEGFGYGLFPRLMATLGRNGKEDVEKKKQRDRELQRALEQLYDYILSLESRACRIRMDGVLFRGSFLLIEVLNIRSIGPNLLLAPFADPGDNELDIVLVHDHQREAFASYVSGIIKGEELPKGLEIHRARQIEFYWNGVDAHIDDEYYRLPTPLEVNIDLHQQSLRFLVPAQSIR